MINTSLVLLQYLQSKNLVGNRIYVQKLPLNFTNTQSAILFFARGGKMDKRAPLYTPSFQFKCYGGTPYLIDAHAVHSALHDALHGITNQSTDEGLILTAHEEIAPQEMIDPDTQWPIILSFFTCNIIGES